MDDDGSASAGGAAGGRRQTLLRDADAGARMKGIGLILLSSLLFTVLDTSAKVVSTMGIPVLEVVFVRYGVHFVLAALILNPVTSPASWRTRKPILQVVRALALTACTAFNFIALQYLQLAQTVTISFLGPLFIAGLSFILFGEKVGPRRLAAILVGFGGILVVTQPGLAGFHPAMLIALLSVMSYSVYALMTRSLAGTESPGSMILVLAGVPTLILAPLMPAVWVWPEDPLLLVLMLVMGVTGGLGHFFVILAHRYATASVLAPFNYIQIVYMVLSGYLVFGDVPTAPTLIGAGIVVASGLYLLHRERVRRSPASETGRAA
ncbi:DMT family transporter [Chthonobacter rhizosphaerae]|uniref:DMT family transporter n=1 Tax=Chthonobacter rhizosphaerae TaxID=2735553 RepID=UPI0015EF173F|nr:DMT family transporter [Chthonobacter rhizosphaerae]